MRKHAFVGFAVLSLIAAIILAYSVGYSNGAIGQYNAGCVEMRHHLLYEVGPSIPAQLVIRVRMQKSFFSGGDKHTSGIIIDATNYGEKARFLLSCVLEDDAKAAPYNCGGESFTLPSKAYFDKVWFNPDPPVEDSPGELRTIRPLLPDRE